MIEWCHWCTGGGWRTGFRWLVWLGSAGLGRTKICPWDGCVYTIHKHRAQFMLLCVIVALLKKMRKRRRRKRRKRGGGGRGRGKKGREKKRSWREKSNWRNGTQTNKKVKIIYLNYICTWIYKTDAGNQLCRVISEKEEISFGCLVRKRFRMFGEMAWNK